MPNTSAAAYDQALFQFKLSLFGLFAITMVGTGGYWWLESLPPIEALYYTIITLTTIGFSEPEGGFSPMGRVFTMFLVVTGVAAFSIFAGMAGRVVVSGEIRRSLGTRRMEERVKNLKKHFIVCGYGRLGQAIAKPFLEREVPFAVVDVDRENFERAIEDGCPAVLGDASSDDVLEQAGLSRAKGLIAACADDAMNVFITLSARQLRPDLFILARATNDTSLKKLMRAGATRAFSPHSIGGAYMAQAALRPSVVDFFDMTTMLGVDSILLEEVEVPADSPRGSRTLRQLSLGKRFGVIIVAIKHGGVNGQTEFNPSAESRVDPGDLLIALGEDVSLKKLCAFFGRDDEEDFIAE